MTADMLEALRDLRAEMVAAADADTERLQAVHEHFRDSARNLLHYLAFRRHDLRPLQGQLARLGLSSLGRAESHVLAAVDAVIGVLDTLHGGGPAPLARPSDLERGPRALTAHTDDLLGAAPAERRVRIMVTMPPEAATDYLLVESLLQQGMNCMRINCAHDDAAAWARMIEHLRRAEAAVGRSCRVVMDLGGPKLRTGPLAPGPAVLKLRPHRDAFGHVVAPARIWLTSASSPHAAPADATATLSVHADWLARLDIGDRVRCVDARGAIRRWTVVDVTDRGCWVESTRTTYVVDGTVLRHVRRGRAEGSAGKTTVSGVPAREAALMLRPGDQLIVTRDQRLGRPTVRDAAGAVLTPASIGCTLPEVFDDVRAGEAIWFDDGRIGGVVAAVEDTQVLVRIVQARPTGERLRSDKGINLPESRLRLAALTAQDLVDLEFVVRHADIVELSFANAASDVGALQLRLSEQGADGLAIVLKVETRRGFENLPEMLLMAMRAPRCGVMIARGDLAVECGFERLAEVQEEILWICEAAHVPVIWATQVLETLAKDGIPSRAEITDAAMGDRAECVMLNKGPHIGQAVRVLDDILRRMQDHQAKKRAMLRELRLAREFVSPSVETSSEASGAA
jgi:pyruvate kinase